MPTNPRHVIALVSMPWSLVNRPSVQLGALKAYIEKNSPLHVDCFHPFLLAAKAISIETYTYLCKKSWAGEAIYSAILYPNKRPDAQKLFQKNCCDNPSVAHQFDMIVAELESQLDSWIHSIDFTDYLCVGFSVSFSQLFSSLTASKRIKKIYPNIKIVFGGSSCVGKIAASLLHTYDQIDYIIEGEGERQLTALCQTFLQETETPRKTKLIVEKINCCQEIRDINSLPVPDYQPYFSELTKLFPALPFSPTLPIEFSRGCWWGKCSFCNLNLQWDGYRHKNAETLVAEVKHLTATHQCLDFAFCDNALPPAEADRFFSIIGKEESDLSFFAEIRAVKNPRKLASYRQSGLHSVQVGIESLSNSLLKKMRKGVTVIENLAVMKYCQENKVTLEGNLILEFPGSTENDADETLKNLEFALPYNPLSAAAFFLGSGSPIEQNPGAYGIRWIVQHRNNAYIFPREVLAGLNVLIKDYRGDKTVQKKRWKIVRQKIAAWHRFHNLRANSSIAPLSYRLGTSFIIIRQERCDSAPLIHRLRGTSAKIYHYCSTLRTMEEIRSAFPQFAEKTLLIFFEDLVNKRLLFQENNTFLSLAVRQRELTS